MLIVMFMDIAGWSWLGKASWLSSASSMPLLNFMDCLASGFVKSNAQTIIVIFLECSLQCLELPYLFFLNSGVPLSLKVKDKEHEQLPLFQAMEEACDDITAQQCPRWIRHSKRFYQLFFANEDVVWVKISDQIQHRKGIWIQFIHSFIFAFVSQYVFQYPMLN